MTKKRIFSIWIIGVLAIAVIVVFYATRGMQADALTAQCSLSPVGAYSVQAGQSIVRNFTGACHPQIAGIEWVCQLSTNTVSPYFTAIGGGGQNFNGVGTAQVPFTITGVAAGSGTFTITSDCSDTIDPDQHPTATETVNVTPAPTSTPPSAVGTVTVTSENAVNTSTLVNAVWDLTGPVNNTIDGIVCSATGALNQTVTWDGVSCSGYEDTYQGVPANASGSNYTIPDATTTVRYYSLRSIERVPIAEKKTNNIFSSMGLSLKDIFSTVAFAWTIPQGNSQTLTPSVPSADFTILWNPLVADMQVSPSTISFTSSGSMSQVATITATGAPSARLKWTASITSGGNWLSVLPSSNTVSVGASGSGVGNATISAASGLPNGTYQGTVTFNGYDDRSGEDVLVATRVITSTLVVTSSGLGYDCESNNQCVSTTTNPQYGSLSSCDTACGGGPPYFACVAGVCAETSSTSGGSSCATACSSGGSGGSTPTATCSPSTITLSPVETSQCVLDLNGVAQNGSWTVAPGSTGSIGTSSGIYTPSAAGTEAVVGTMPDGVKADATIVITSGGPSQLPACTPGVGVNSTCPVCSPSLTATPSTIVVPESSDLSYSCRNVTQCQISGAATGQFSTPTDVPASGNVSTTPSVTTTYTLACINGDYAPGVNNSAGGSATVTVSGSTYCEQNPNGVGCQ